MQYCFRQKLHCILQGEISSCDMAFNTHVNLLLYSQGTTRHYRLKNDLNRLIYDQNPRKARMFFCHYCLHGFIREDLLRGHEPHCCQHGPQRIELPNEDNSALAFPPRLP